jgi:hypothetical protein
MRVSISHVKSRVAYNKAQNLTFKSGKFKICIDFIKSHKAIVVLYLIYVYINLTKLSKIGKKVKVDLHMEPT